MSVQCPSKRQAAAPKNLGLALADRGWYRKLQRLGKKQFCQSPDGRPSQYRKTALKAPPVSQGLCRCGEGAGHRAFNESVDCH